MEKKKIPELLMPAGSLEKLKVAVLYGADAVYLGGQKFGLRAASDNFTLDELKEGVIFAHERGVKVYVVLNGFLHDKDLEDLPEFVKYLEALKVDAVIVSELGVFKVVQKNSHIPIHLSTQASCLNSWGSALWKNLGATRIILGREVSVKEAGKIGQLTGMEMELFIHGSLCMSYSGHCVISNYTQGRDSNRGGCAHSCRFEYSYEQEGEKKKAFFMSSKDLEGVLALPQFLKEEITSIKVEGRMKNHLYAAVVTKIYREALDEYAMSGTFSEEKLHDWAQELRKIPHRDETLNNLLDKANADSIYTQKELLDDGYKVAGVVLEVVSQEFMLIQVKNAFEIGDHLDLIPFKAPIQTLIVNEMMNLMNDPITRTKPNTLVKIPYVAGVEVFNILRKGHQS